MEKNQLGRREFLLASLGAACFPLTTVESFATSVVPKQAEPLGLDRHRFGVTYTPSKNWFFCWNDFDTASISRDLDDIAHLGSDHIRMMLLWPDFQPNHRWVSPTHLERLDRFMELCAKRNLDVQLCMLNGFVSGLRFLPSYVVGHSAEEFYELPAIWEAQELFFRQVAKIVNRHGNFLGFDLSNEMPNAWSTGTNTAIGDAWCERILNLCEALCPNKVHVNGAWGHWFFQDTFSAELMAKRPAAAIMHCYGRYAGAPGKLLDAPSVQLPASTAALIRAYAADPHKPVWCQEYGVSDNWDPATDIVSFVEKSTLAGIEGGVGWFTWWSSHDLNRSMEFDPAEYQFGLVTNDHKIKPQGRAFKAIAEKYRGKPVTIPTQKPEFLKPPRYEDTWKWLLKWIDADVKR